MYWTLELASHLEDAPWPATKDELIDYAIRSGAPFRGLLKTSRNLKMKANLMKILKRYGPTILPRMISSLMKMSISGN